MRVKVYGWRRICWRIAIVEAVIWPRNHTSWGDEMKRIPLIPLAALLITFPSAAQDNTVLQNRLAVFQNAQTACKSRVLLDYKLASSLVLATKSSFSAVCECAALLAVASRSDEQLASVLAGDKDSATEMVQEVVERLGQCAAIN